MALRTPGLIQAAMVDDWDLIDHLIGGTRAMRSARTKYLPREPGEDIGEYETRLERSVLYGMYANTVRRLCDKPFVEPVTVTNKDGGAVPDVVVAITKDTDGTRRSLTSLAQAIMCDGVHRGLFHVLVDFTRRKDGATANDTRSSRPYFVQIDPRSVVRARLGEDGELDDFRFRVKEIEVSEEKDEEVFVDYLYRWTRTEIYKWRLGIESKDASGNVKVAEDELVEGWPQTNNLQRIPLVTGYMESDGFMHGRPALRDLAELNVVHWQSFSDQRNILRYARFALLFLTGFDAEHVETYREEGIPLHPRNIIMAGADADGKYIEHSGASIEQGRLDIQDLEARGEILGVQPLLRETKSSTATGQMIDDDNTSSRMESWVRAVQTALMECFEWAALWLGDQSVNDVDVHIFNEFAFLGSAASDVDALIKLYASGVLTAETLLEEFKKRGILSDQLDVRREVSEAATAATILGDVGGVVADASVGQ